MTEMFCATTFNTDYELLLIALVGVFAVVCIILACWLLTKFIKKPNYAKAIEEMPLEERPKVKFNFVGILIAIAIVALIVRLLFSILIMGYRDDFNDLYSLAISSIGSSIGDNSISSYPLISYIYYVFGSILRIGSLDLDVDSLATVLLLKAPLILADIASIVILYKIAAKFNNEYTGLIIAGFYAFFPIFIISSAVWGSTFSIVSLVFLLTFYYFVTKNSIGFTICYSLALYTSVIALYLFPIILIYTIFNYVNACKALKFTPCDGFADIVRNKSTRTIVMLPVYVIVSLAAMWAIALPLGSLATLNPFTWFSTFFLNPLSSISLFGENTLNIFALFLKNGEALGSEFPKLLFSIIFMVIIAAIMLLVYLSRKNRANLLYLVSYCILTLTVYFVDFSAMDAIVVVALLLLALIFIRDRRLLTIAGVIGLCMTLNTLLIMNSAGYLNMLEESYFSLSTYLGETILEDGGYLAMSIILSSIMIIVHLYSTIVLLDISMSENRKTYDEKNKTLISSLKNLY